MRNTKMNSSLIDDLGLETVFERDFLHNIYYKNLVGRPVYVKDIERRLVIKTLETIGLDSDWVYIEDTRFFELFIETEESSITLTFKELSDLEKAVDFILDYAEVSEFI